MASTYVRNTLVTKMQTQSVIAVREENKTTHISEQSAARCDLWAGIGNNRQVLRFTTCKWCHIISYHITSKIYGAPITL